MSATVLHGNALALPVADASVDLIVTSPPYFGLRSYQDGGQHYAGQIGAEATPTEFVDALIAATREMARVLKPTGSIFVNLGDKVVRKGLLNLPHRYAIRCADDLLLTQRQELIWHKPTGLPVSPKDRAETTHETWFHFVKAQRYFANMDNLREPHAGRTHELAAFDARRAVEGRAFKQVEPRSVEADRRKTFQPPPNPLGKLPGSVWTVPTQPLYIPPHLNVRHFAAFPMEWPRRFIKGWCPPDGVVLDPFGGTGTTATVAHALGRHGITVDLSHDYCRVAQWRTTDPAQLAKAAQAPKPRPVVVATGEGDVEVPADEPDLMTLLEEAS